MIRLPSLTSFSLLLCSFETWLSVFDIPPGERPRVFSLLPLNLASVAAGPIDYGSLHFMPLGTFAL